MPDSAEMWSRFWRADGISSLDAGSGRESPRAGRLRKSDAPHRIELFQWYSDVAAEVAARSRSAASL